MNNLSENEVLDDLQNSYYIIQKNDGFKFGTDAVLLSDFAKDCGKNKILDLCSGTGIIPILLAAKTNAQEIYGLEIQEEMWEMSCRSVKYNKLEDRVKPVLGDLKNCKKLFTPHSFGAVTCNPPYMKSGSNVKNIPESIMISRHECMCDIEDVIKAAADMLTFKGSFYMVHRPSRIADIICAMRKFSVEPKLIRFVHPYEGKEPVLVLIKGTYHGGSDLKIMPPMYIYEKDGRYTEELDIIYKGQKG